MSSASSGAGGGALRPLRTRRPFTPRDPQRTLFTERTKKKDNRPPSAFDLKYLTLQESHEGPGGRSSEPVDFLHQSQIMEPPVNRKKTLRNQSRSIQERPGEPWGGFPKLPHLNGRSKPLHRRNTSHNEEPKNDELAQAISVTRPIGCPAEGSFLNGYATEAPTSKSLSLDVESKKRHYAEGKSVSFDATDGVGDINVRHLAVQLPNASGNDYDTMSLLELTEALGHRTRDTDRIEHLMEALQNSLEKNCPTNSLRDLVLRALYTHIDSDDERVLVAIAKAMFTMRVIGNHLAAACKLIFKIARNDKNDHFFRNSNLLELLVEGCGRADPLSEGECCVYGAGALRFLALEPRLCVLAHRAGALHLAALHLKMLNMAKAENSRAVTEQSTHALYQLTGALRNLAGAGQNEIKSFVASGALGELVNALLHHTDRDVLTNVARCLSVLSAEESCCAWLCASPISAHALLRALAACGARAPLAVRLAYTLGNMAAADEQARRNIYDEEAGVDVLLTILESYTKKGDNDSKDFDDDPDLHLVGSDLGGSDGSNEDVLIKTIRVVANLCLAEHAGLGLASTHAERAIKALLACLDLAERPTDLLLNQYEEEQQSWRERREELATAALATLNNITFYREPDTDYEDPNDLSDATLDMLCKVSCRWLTGAGAASREAVRALGNLSRASPAAQRLVLHGALDRLVPFVQHEDVSVRCAAAGVLVNVCGAGVECEAAAALAAQALSSAASVGDSPAAALLARALWNAQAHETLATGTAQLAVAALTVFVEDDSVFAPCEAPVSGERRASDPEISKYHVKFDIDNNNYAETDYNTKLFPKSSSVDQNLHLGEHSDPHYSDEDADRTGEDLGFEDGDVLGDEDCNCEPCRNISAWEELVGVAIPLLEKLKPQRADASVGTD